MKRIPTRAAGAMMLTLTLALTGCAAETDDTDVTKPSGSSSGPASATEATEVQSLLAEYGLDATDVEGIIDHLDTLGGDERPENLVASVRPDELVVSDGGDEFGLEIPDDRFYLSVAPYVDQTHDCFYHSLTTCQGELAATDVQVTIVDETNDEVLVDETRTTFENGFTGFWLPRDIEGTLRVTYDGKSGETQFATDEDAPTCLTTLQLA